MKKIAASVGLLALGASALHAAESSTLNNMQTTKAWSVQASLRGFYDDNINAAPAKVDSLGFTVSPSVNFGVAGEQTSFNVGYDFTANYYDKARSALTSDRSDYTHALNADFSHAFSPTLDLSASESFVIGQEPDLLRDPASTQRIDGDNIRNFASVNMNVGVTRLLSFSFGYNNSYYDYADDTLVTVPTVAPVGQSVVSASSSGLYDRMEHALRFDSRWKVRPQTTGIIGYTYGQSSYLGDQPIIGNTGIAPGALGGVVMSDFRDSRSHIFYVGAEQVFNSALSGLLKVGGQFTDYFNDPAGESQWSPYIEASLRYQYQEKSSVDVGVRHNRSSGNDAGGAGTTFVRDMATTTVYASIKQALASKLFLTGSITAQHSTYNAPGSVGVGGIDDESYTFYQLGLDLSYEINRNFSTHLGYNYDKLKSDLAGRDYKRNRVYLGLTAGF